MILWRFTNMIHSAWWRCTNRCPRHLFFAIIDDDDRHYLYHACLMCGARLSLTSDAPSPLRYER